ncbi:MAG: nuclear transport factor 2 family protein [Bradyrhizobium sp.]|nr:nuclear transport factor 2 family protein [Bradyrhizobium sp.]
MTMIASVSAGSSMRAAMERRDVRAVADAFAADAQFHSPLTDRLTFRGREQIAALATIVLDVFENFRYTDELMGDEVGFLVGRAQVDGLEIEFVDHLRFDRDGRIADITVFFRPLPAAAAALRRIGARLGRRKSPMRGAVISMLARPLALMTRIGDAIGARLLRASIRS